MIFRWFLAASAASKCAEQAPPESRTLEMSSWHPSMGSPDFLQAARTGAQLPGSDMMQETDPRTYKWLLFQPLRCLHPFGHLSVFLLHPFPACKKGFAPLR